MAGRKELRIGIPRSGPKRRSGAKRTAGRIIVAKVYYDKDADPKYLEGKTVAVIGFGSQGHAHALNLHDSGVDVRVGLRTGSKSWNTAREAGLKVLTPREAAAPLPVRTTSKVLIGPQFEGTVGSMTILCGWNCSMFFLMMFSMSLGFFMSVGPMSMKLTMPFSTRPWS